MWSIYPLIVHFPKLQIKLFHKIGRCGRYVYLHYNTKTAHYVFSMKYIPASSNAIYYRPMWIVWGREREAHKGRHCNGNAGLVHNARLGIVEGSSHCPFTPLGITTVYNFCTIVPFAIIVSSAHCVRINKHLMAYMPKNM